MFPPRAVVTSRSRPRLSNFLQVFIRPMASSTTTKTRSSSSRLPKCLQIESNVKDALKIGKPVVALESTIVSHGMPFPQNLELAKEVEEILKAKGVVPATIAIKNGVCRIGLSSEELEDLARAGEEGRATKCSTRDLPFMIMMGSRANYSAEKDDNYDNDDNHNDSASDNHSSVCGISNQWGSTTVASTMKLAHLAGISTFVTGGIGGVHRNGHISMDVSADLTELSRTPVVVVSAGVKSILDIERTLEVLETNSVPTFGWKTDEFPAFFSAYSGVHCPARVEDADDVASIYCAARELELPQGMLVAVPNHDPAGENVEKAIQLALMEAEEHKIHGQAVTPFILKKVADMTAGDSLRSNMALLRQNAEVGANIAIAIASSATNSQKISSTSERKTANGIKGSRNLAILRGNSDLRMSPISPDQPVQDEIVTYADILVLDGGQEVVERGYTAKQAIRNGANVVFVPSGVKCAIAASNESRFLPCVHYAIIDVDELLALRDGWTDSPEDLMFALREPKLVTIRSAIIQILQRMNKSQAHVLISMWDKGLYYASRNGTDDVFFQHFTNKSGLEIRKGTAASDCLCGAFVHNILEGRDPLKAAKEAVNAVDSLYSEGQIMYPFLSQLEAKM